MKHPKYESIRNRIHEKTYQMFILGQIGASTQIRKVFTRGSDWLIIWARVRI